MILHVVITFFVLCMTIENVGCEQQTQGRVIKEVDPASLDILLVTDAGHTPPHHQEAIGNDLESENSTVVI